STKVEFDPAMPGSWACLDSNQGPRDYESPALTAVLQARRKSRIVARRPACKIHQSRPRCCPDNPEMATTPDLLRVARLMHRNLSGRHSLHALAAATGLPPFHLQREFTRLAGESPASFARRLRLLAAITELLRGDAPLRQVARRAGFGSTEVLIRNFRPLFGCTPEQYRRRARACQRDDR